MAYPRVGELRLRKGAEEDGKGAWSLTLEIRMLSPHPSLTIKSVCASKYLLIELSFLICRPSARMKICTAPPQDLSASVTRPLSRAQ